MMFIWSLFLGELEYAFDIPVTSRHDTGYGLGNQKTFMLHAIYEGP